MSEAPDTLPRNKKDHFRWNGTEWIGADQGIEPEEPIGALLMREFVWPALAFACGAGVATLMLLARPEGNGEAPIMTVLSWFFLAFIGLDRQSNPFWNRHFAAFLWGVAATSTLFTAASVWPLLPMGHG